MSALAVAAVNPGLRSSVGKALSLLRSFDRYPGGARLTELANDAGLARSSTHRLLGALRTAGLVDREGMDWYLSPSLVLLGAGAARGEANVLREVALPFMADLYEATKENVHLAFLSGVDVVYLEKLYGHASWPAPSRVGHRLPAYASALGKCLLAHAETDVVDAVLGGPMKRLTPMTTATPGALARQLKTVGATGVAIEREEAREGLACVAAPIRTSSGHVVAAISIGGRSGRFRPEAFAAVTRRAAESISARLGPSSDLLRDNRPVSAGA